MYDATAAPRSGGGRSPYSGAYDALVLAGGGARRLGGADKPALQVGGASLLDRVLAAVEAAREVVVVGPQRPTRRAVAWCREEPAGAGPVHALATALPRVTAPLVAVLAADLPFLDTDVVAQLLTASEGRDGALLVDDTGREQLLAGVWQTERLRAAVDSLPTTVDASMRSLRATLDPALVTPPARPDGPPVWLDCDTPADLDEARSWR